ncbi:MAG TPA: T3SS effector HopA1 family protein [Symbiobacteriaceae bacterium]|nr:T3SS effector HopA1 family protein [Symbiobacteriaceae bacterium]
MNRYRRQIEVAVAGVRFGGASCWYWFGRPVPILPRTTSPDMARRTLLYSLQNHLYAQLYCRGLLERPRGPAPAPWPVSAELEPLDARMAAANAGHGCWQSGWLGEGTVGEEMLVARDGLHLRVDQRDCMSADIQPGAIVKLWMGKDLPAASPGFFMILGDAEVQGPLLRVYWNVTADGAVPLVRAVTTTFNRARLPFQLKLLNNPRQYGRCDAAVLYAGRGQYSAVREMLPELYHEVAGHLREPVPAFTKPLAPGVGLAEDPAGQNASFGQHRCGQLALALTQAHEAGLSSTDERTRFVMDRLVQAGINPDAPYLDPGSSDIYQPLETQRGAPASPAAQSFLDTAVGIGLRLGREAIWHGERCNWVGPLPQGREIRHGSLGPDFYAGTAGIAWFLTELGAVTGEATARRTALGAIDHALTQAEAGALKPGGLYTGVLGVVLAGVRTGQLLGAEGPLIRARQLLHRWLQTDMKGEGFDLLDGHAGIVLALLTLHRYLADDGALLEVAAACGRRLLPLPDRLSYGLAHGAAGVGLALLELSAACGEPEFGRAADQAFARERRRQPPAFPPVWCRGAAGVALSRLRAYQLTGDPRYLAEVRRALAETRQLVEDALRNQHTDFSLCHGLTGCAEVLRACTGLPGVATAEADQVARMGASRCGAGRNPWPCGLGYNETPGLLTGLAGIGLFYLRLCRPDVPSVLLLSP